MKSAGLLSTPESLSFCIRLSDISAAQLLKIKGHRHIAKESSWSIFISKTSGTVRGFTEIDDFDMAAFLRNIGVPAAVIVWEEGWYE